MQPNSRVDRRSDGFTVIELLISTVVFAMILLGATTAILQFTHVYYKGITENSVQETTRSIVNQISQEIQFSGGNVGLGQAYNESQMYCIGNQRYSYLIGRELSDNPTSSQAPHVLVADNDASGCTSSEQAQDLKILHVVLGRELLAPNMRLAIFSITPTGANVYKVRVKVVYGEDDLLTDPTAVTGSPHGGDTNCKSGQAGTQFCAESDITATVVKRVQ